MAIDVGSAATDRSRTTYINGYTNIPKANPVNADGTITIVGLWAATDMTGLKVGTFSGSGTSWDDRDYETIGSVTSGSKQVFTGLSITAVTGDLLGCVSTVGNIEIDTRGGKGHFWVAGDKFGAGASTYTSAPEASTFSLYGAGIELSTVTTQEESSVTATSMVANGNITDTGGSGSDVTRRGFCYMEGSSGDPTTANSTAYDDGTFGTGAYTKSITGLTPDTNYRIRAFAVNAAGTAYGATVQAKTPLSAPIVTTQEESSVTATSMTANGNITATGGSGSDVTRRGFCYMEGDSGDPTTENSTVYDDGTFGTGAFTKSITGLSSSTNYRIRAYAVNAAGTSYGTTVQATTLSQFVADVMCHHFIPSFLGGR